jgi:ABC-type multidrug transport system fused ATPase/permease subunit
MSTVDNGIAIRQNAELNIKVLAVQRQLYDEAKTLSVYQFILCILVPIIILFVKQFIPSDSIALGLITLFSILIIILNAYVFEKITKSKKEKAARFQEIFDTNVLKIAWNSALCGPRDRALHDVEGTFKRYSKKHESLDDLKNWYSKEYAEVDIFAGRIMCQRVNTAWDSNLRNKFKTFLKILFVSCVLIIAVIAVFKNNNVVNTLVSIVAPLVPICLYLYKQHTENKATISRLDRLSYKVDDLWEKALSNVDASTLTASSRKLQNDLYKHRESALMIWDWFYWFFRNKQEYNMSLSAAMVVEEYQQSKQILA